MKKILSISLCILFCFSCGLKRTYDGRYVNKLEAEKNKIYLLNKSFEEHTKDYGIMKNGINYTMNTDFYIPEPWLNCEDRFSAYTLDGNNSKYNEVSIKAIDGYFYIALGVTKTGMKGLLAQKLSRDLEEGKRHRMYLFVSYAPTFAHYISQRSEPLNYPIIIRTGFLSSIIDQPSVLRVWGSNDGCELEELLYESGIIDNTNWKEIEITFIPKEKYRYLVFEPYCEFTEGNASNVLIDNFSNIDVRE